MFANTGIRTLLTWGFGIVFALIVVQAAIIFQRSSAVGSHITEVSKDAYPKAVAAAHQLEELAAGLSRSIGSFRT